jgi:hypothetical protein
MHVRENVSPLAYDIAFFFSWGATCLAVSVVAWELWKSGHRKRKENEIIDDFARDLASSLEERQLYYQETLARRRRLSLKKDEDRPN